MNKQKTPKVKFKVIKSGLAKTIQVLMPCIEEISDKGMTPLCIIGFKSPNKDKIVETTFATVSDDESTMLVMYDICKNMVNQLKERFEPKSNERTDSQISGTDTLKHKLEKFFKETELKTLVKMLKEVGYKFESLPKDEPENLIQDQIIESREAYKYPVLQAKDVKKCAICGQENNIENELCITCHNKIESRVSDIMQKTNPDEATVKWCMSCSRVNNIEARMCGFCESTLFEFKTGKVK